MPRELIRVASESPFEAFIQQYLDTMFLLIELTDGDEELRQGLLANLPRSDGDDPTAQHGLDTLVSVVARNRRVLKRAPDPSVVAALEALADDVPYFVLPLVSRSGKPRLTVGRGVRRDVVLRHPTVSKSHAWIECGDGCLTVGDAGSKNRTYRNGRLLSAPERSFPADTLRFGSVQCSVASSDMVWAAVQQVAGA